MNYNGEVGMSAEDFAEIVLRVHDLEEQAKQKETFRSAWEAVTEENERLKKELEELKKEDDF